MSVTVTTNGAGRLQLNGALNRKPALDATGDGWWMLFWLQMPPTYSNQRKMLLGDDSNGDSDFNDNSELGATLSGIGSRQLMFWGRYGANPGTNYWAAAGLTNNQWSSMDSMDSNGVYLVGFGWQDFDGSGDYRLMSFCCERNAAINATRHQVLGAGSANGIAPVEQVGIERVFSNYALTPDTPAGTAIEHVALYRGLFPLDGGELDTSVIEALASGEATYGDLPGDVTHWWPLTDNATLDSIGSAGSDPFTIDGEVVTGTALAPWETLTIDEPVSGQGYVIDGILGPSVLRYSGTKSAAITVLQARVDLLDAAGAFVSTVVDWTDEGFTLDDTSWSLAYNGLPTNTGGQRYRFRVRDADDASNEKAAAYAFGVGWVIGLNDQSQFQIMMGAKSPPNAGEPAYTANQCSMLYTSVRQGGGAEQVTKISSATAYGSAISEMAERIVAEHGLSHAPVMFVDIAYEGEGIGSWLADTAPDSGWGLWSGFMTRMMERCHYRLTAMVRMSVINAPAYDNLGLAYDAFADQLDTLLVNNPTPALMWLVPPLRSGSGDTTGYNYTRWRGEMMQQAAKGGRWALCTMPLSVMANTDGSVHEATGSSGDTYGDADAAYRGVLRLGRYIGAGVAALMKKALGQVPTNPGLGPVPVSMHFTSAAKTAFVVTFDRDIQHRDESTAGSRQVWLTTDDGSTKAEAVAGLATVALTGARTAVVTKDSGDWSDVTLKAGVMLDCPFQTKDSGLSETDAQDLLDTAVIHGTDDFEDGGGMIMRPLTALWMDVQDYVEPSEGLAPWAARRTGLRPRYAVDA
jgi:hypothetical protein